MHLRKLEVQGFKAFADRQTFEFGPGITVVAGPNGSGKSNVHDAIRWALGFVGRNVNLETGELTIPLDEPEEAA